MNKSISLPLVLISCLLLPQLIADSCCTASEREPLNIAAIFSLTGQGAVANRSSVLGVNLAVEEINQRGGLLGRGLNLLLLDNMSTPIGSNLAAIKAAQADVIGIIGSQWSSHSLAVAKVAEQHKIPMISNFSTHPELTGIGEHIFRVCYTDDFQGKVMAEFARNDLEAQSALLFVDITSDYSLALSSIFQTHFSSLGGSIVGEIEYKKKKGNFNEIVEHARGKSADVIFLSGHEESGAIALRLQNAGVEAHLLGGDGWGDPSFLQMGGDRLARGYFCNHWSADSERQESKDFVMKYGDNMDFGTGTALAYDAVMVFAGAVERAGSSKSSEIVKALLTIDSHEGVTGTIQFDDKGDPLKRAVIMEIRDGRPSYLKSLRP